MSAYGNVGLSLGYPTINASFSAEFRTLSKLVIVAMQIRGRHRGLPYNLDRAVSFVIFIILAKGHIQRFSRDEALGVNLPPLCNPLC